jgi:hypothetical protein
MERWLVLLVACGSPHAAGPPVQQTMVMAGAADDAGTPVAVAGATDASVDSAPLSHVSCQYRMTEPPPRPDTECGSCYKDWERRVENFRPVRILSCSTCEIDADCGGTTCARAAGFNQDHVKVCISQRCDGMWRARGKRATCEPMRL